jgi:hypothetical protein
MVEPHSRTGGVVAGLAQFDDVCVGDQVAVGEAAEAAHLIVAGVVMPVSSDHATARMNSPWVNTTTGPDLCVLSRSGKSAVRPSRPVKDSAPGLA